MAALSSATQQGLTIEPAETPAQIEAFIRFPFELYRGYPHWVPPLLMERRDFLNPKKNPLYEYAQVRPLIARSNGRVVGTIAAVRNDRYGQYHNDERGVGFFGLYECIDDQAVAYALLGAAAAWLGEQGFNVMRGPVNLTTNDVVGLLVDGFDDDPVLLMPYNPPYYAAQLESFGLRKCKDLLAFEATVAQSTGKLDEIADKLLARGRCTIRPVNLSRFRDELEFLAKELKPLVDPRLTFVGEVDGKPAGISISIPDANEGLRLAKGHLFPTGLLKLLWRVKVRRCRRVRTVALGVLPEHRRLGLETILIQRTIRNSGELGYFGGELGWILEDNEAMLRPIRRLGARQTKVFRVYDRPLP